MNRGIARRTVFECDADFRMFLACLATEVHDGRLEVHAFCLLPTHFHLLVRSPSGELSRAMRRLQNRFARWFNRSRKRDGPLFRGRFLSREVDSLEYRRNVVTYIHDNPVDAGLVAGTTLYEWSSAHGLARSRRPPWLSTGWVEDELARRGGVGSVRDQLAAAFPSRVEPEFRAWIEKQLHARLPEEDEDVSLRYAGSPRVVRWMFRKADLADGTRPFRPVRAPSVVERVVRSARSRLGPLVGLFRSRAKDAWIALRAGLLRLLAGCTHREIGLRSRRHTATSCRDVQDHILLLHAVPSYEKLTAQLAAAILT
jgi:REP element-mobilizing transposase RayT